jgi:hypothetical protein
MSQTSQAHAHHRGMDITRNTPPGGLVGASPEVVGRSRSTPSGAGTAAQKEKIGWTCCRVVRPPHHAREEVAVIRQTKG